MEENRKRLKKNATFHRFENVMVWDSIALALQANVVFIEQAKQII